MPTITYNITLDKLPELLRRIYYDIPNTHLREVTKGAASLVHTDLVNNCPTSKDRGYRGPPLRFSVMTKDISKSADNPVFIVTPTKKVSSSKGEYNLAAILENGSKGGQVILPINGPYLKFTATKKVGGKLITKQTASKAQLKMIKGTKLEGKAISVFASKRLVSEASAKTTSKAVWARRVIRGDIPPQHFIRKTFNQSRSKVPDYIVSKLTEIYSRESTKIRESTAEDIEKSGVPTL